MFASIKSFFGLLKIHSNLFESFLSLSILNAVNLLLPLVTLPYLVRVIGLEKYGVYSVIYAIIQYVLLLSAYGFNYTTTRQIAQDKNDSFNISLIFFSTIASRFLISIPICFFFFFLIKSFYSVNHLFIYIGGVGIIVGDILNPVWLYQGLEKMRFLTLVNMICKFLFIFLIFVFIKEESDYIYITYLYSAGYVLAGFLSLIISFKVFHIHLVPISISNVCLQLKLGWPVFLSTLFMNLYRNSNVFIFSFFLSDYNVGIYSAAEKVVKAVQSIISPISNALFPFFASESKLKSNRDNVIYLVKIGQKMFFVFLLIMLFLILFSDIINSFLFATADEKISVLICALSPVIVVGGLNYIFGIVGLINLNCNYIFFKYVSISGIFSLILLLLTVSYLSYYSGALSMTCSEILLLCLCLKKIKDLKDEK